MFFGFVYFAGEATPGEPRGVIWTSSATASAKTTWCPGHRKGLEWYKTHYNKHRSTQGLAPAPRTVDYLCDVTHRRAGEWRDRAKLERHKAQRWLRAEYADPPYPFYQIAVCETGGINGGRPLWTHNSGTYQGAYGFTVAAWDQFAPPGAPSEAYLATPRQQTDAARAIVARFGGYGSWPACHRRLGLSS